MDPIQHKIRWEGIVVAVQPRSTVWRYLVDNRTHREIGYNIFLNGTFDAGFLDEESLVRENRNYSFAVAISETQQNKLQAAIGDHISGTGWTKEPL